MPVTTMAELSMRDSGLVQWVQGTSNATILQETDDVYDVIVFPLLMVSR